MTTTTAVPGTEARTEIMEVADQATPLPASQAVTPMEMITMALQNGADIEILDKLMALQERYERNMGRKAFDRAIAAAKSEIKPIVKTQTANRGNAGTYVFEDLATIAEQVDPILSKYGLSYRFRTAQQDDRIFVTCVVSHRDGYFEETTLNAGADATGAKNAAQAIGSSVTYLQRYTLKAALGLAAARDDDAARFGVQFINEEQFRILRSLLDETGADEEKFLAYMKAPSLEEMTQQQFARALTELKRKKEHKE